MRAVALALLVFLGPAIHAAERNPAPVASTILNPEKEGQELAARLRAATPAASSEFGGVLEISRQDGKQSWISFHSETAITETNWQVIYRSSPTNDAPAETLVITHTPGQPSRYVLTVGTNAVSQLALTRSFGGSDFWLIDLGLEFFHWPQQRILRAEMSRTRPCRVLESVDPKPSPGGYARVISWIDNESGGILQAEAYDTTSTNRPVKKFILGPMKKVQGQYQPREMRMRNTRTGQQTELKFDLKGE